MGGKTRYGCAHEQRLKVSFWLVQLMRARLNVIRLIAALRSPSTLREWSLIHEIPCGRLRPRCRTFSPSSVKEAHREDPGSKMPYPGAWSLLLWHTRASSLSFRESRDMELPCAAPVLLKEGIQLIACHRDSKSQLPNE